MTNYYVKTDGNDASDGLSWANAWKTVGHAFQNVPASSVLYIEQGLYGLETLSNINPANPPLNMKIQPAAHTDTPCAVYISDQQIFTTEPVPAKSTGNFINGLTVIYDGLTVPQTGNIHKCSFWTYLYSAPTWVKLKIFRDNGLYYDFISESEPFYVDITLNTWTIITAYISATANTGDYIGIQGIGNSQNVGQYSSSGYDYIFRSGDITTNTLKSEWSSYPDRTGCITISGFY